MTIIGQLEIFSNPFNLSFILSGSSSEWFEMIDISGPNVYKKQLFVGEHVASREEMIQRIRTLLANVLENGKKVFGVLPNEFGENPRFLTKGMADKIIDTLQKPDTWRVDTHFSHWKKLFLTKQDGLIAGQKIVLIYKTGAMNGERRHLTIQSDIRKGYQMEFAGKLKDGNPVQSIETTAVEGTFLVSTRDFICTIDII